MKIYVLLHFEHLRLVALYKSLIMIVTSFLCSKCNIVRALREEQPLRLLLNLLFYHFNRSEPTYKSQRMKLPDVIAACNQLNVNALN